MFQHSIRNRIDDLMIWYIPAIEQHTKYPMFSRIQKKYKNETNTELTPLNEMHARRQHFTTPI